MSTPTVHASDAPFAAFAPISLDELNAAAGLQTRVDRKYVLPASALPMLLAAVPTARVLEFADGSRGSRYESVYYDTPELDSYRLAAHGRRRRFKVRTRHYLDTGAGYLEVKTRGGRSTTVKERLELGDAPQVLAGAPRDYVDGVLGDCGIRVPDRTLRRTLVTRYRRTTLLLPGDRGESRATIDQGLEWVDQEPGFERRMLLPGRIIVETKSAGQASVLDRALWRMRHRPTTISKFGTGLAALRPGLPANKWRRTLDRHFAAADIRVERAA
ncbi:polyphosphate polymerase domain-containing protein [Agromyces archimandritae]|uniref:Polyphosphate polymerase domain-containing protein n=1 Tax=Agromyces archimandritae TaxID=2781962 RepID=A0A975FQ82_9MICO|nr:polyphosphate polymerase domain-containing protein [Agromyces archimandritae]QTX05698.1 polyphosphate polymerase domain-containing protein [Agromyces archimandritae]